MRGLKKYIYILLKIKYLKLLNDSVNIKYKNLVNIWTVYSYLAGAFVTKCAVISHARK